MRTVMAKQPTQSRRGVLLLVILGMLAMFGLVAIAFVILTGQFRRTAEVTRRIDIQAESPHALLEDAFAQVVRGSTNPASALSVHSLLEDQYGSNSWIVSLPTSSIGMNRLAGGEMLLFPIGATLPATVSSTDVNAMLAGRVGSVLTPLDGPAAGKSTRILYYLPNTTAASRSYCLQAFEGVTYNELMAYYNSARTQPRRVLINGAPFSGTGAGSPYVRNSSTPTHQRRMDLLSTLPFAPIHLLPQEVVATGASTFPYQGRPNMLSGSPFGQNEDYDIPDHQNMLLAMAIPPADRSSAVINGGITVPIPSLHRSDLVQFWQRKKGTNLPKDLSSTTDASTLFPDWSTNSAYIPMFYPMWSRITARPMGVGAFGATVVPHPDFTGSNPAYNPSVAGSGFDPRWDGRPVAAGGTPKSWDVDNDGDGVADSVWVDLGMPVRAMPDGRLYKPLFAVLCTDLDGRFNLNAHGSTMQAQAAYYNTATITGVEYAGNPNPTVAAINLRRGLGFGPAEVNMSYLFSTYTSSLTTNYQRMICERYGDTTVGSSTNLSAQAGILGTANPLFANQVLNYRNTYNSFGTWPWWTGITIPSGYLTDAWGTPPDLNGDSTVILDASGRPIWYPLATPAAVTNVHWPYEFRLDPQRSWPLRSNTWVDRPYTPAELERVLRPGDVDTNLLPTRLLDVTGGNNPGNVLIFRNTPARNAVTTASYEVPAPASVRSPDRGAFNTGDASTSPTGGLAMLLYAKTSKNVTNWQKLVYGTTGAGGRLLGPALPPELLEGKRFDLNWAFGNGRDDNGNGVVDEPGEATSDTFAEYTKTGTVGTSVATDQTAIGDTNTISRSQARQDYCRWLYTLAVLVCNPESIGKTLAGTDPYSVGTLPTGVVDANNYRKGCRALAQWAVNVVDFRDRDAISTVFFYDVNPFDGWLNETSSTNYVIGVEKPQLIISETFAMHDVRTEDTADETPEPSTDPKATTDDPDPMKRDKDFDQRMRPEGSLFVELYNPNSPHDAPAPELQFNASASIRSQGILLNQRASASSYPVWRFAITRNDDVNRFDPDNPDPTLRPDIERSVYFTQPPGGAVPGGNPDGFRYCVQSTLPMAPVLPGRYAVVGPGDGSATTSYTYIGFETGKDKGEPATTRCIELRPDASPNTNQVELKQGADTTVTTNVQPAVAVIVNQHIDSAGGSSPRRLSISEPTDDCYEAAPGYSSSDQRYAPPLDIPLDSPSCPTNVTMTDTERQLISRTGTHMNFRTVHLQRLADPTRPFDNQPVNAGQPNPAYNPYVTVDSQCTDLHAFNGVTSKKDPTDPGSSGDIHFATRERGLYEKKLAPVKDLSNPWPQDLLAANTGYLDGRKTTPPTGSHYMGQSLAQTLGYLNDVFGAPYPGTANTGYKGSPMIAFPWIAWLDRPFANAYELMMVPRTRSSQMLNPANFSIGLVTTSPYIADSGHTSAQIPFFHLTNYMASDLWTTGTSTARPELHRLLEYVYVPSRFLDAVQQTNPVRMTVGSAPNNLPQYLPFHPPYHNLSTYREPGKINLNTLYSFDVWLGLLNYSANVSATDRLNNFRQFWLTQSKGYSGTLAASTLAQLYDGVLQISNTRAPTRFMNPVRSYQGAYLMGPMWDTGGNVISPLADTSPPVRREVDVTALRSHPQTALNRPLLAGSSLATPAGAYYENADRNAYFRYQGMERLGNSITNRSSVYAVWITVGYFEAQPVALASYNAMVYPDGVRLGKEIGIDDGNVRRHRAFYMFDRSVPMGFSRGEDLNMDKGVLLRRFIE